MGKTKAKKRTFKQFLEDKDIEVSLKKYFVDAMGGMAQGLFASLLVGTILSTLAKYLGMIDNGFVKVVADFIAQAGSLASAATGAAIGVGIAASLKAPRILIPEIRTQQALWVFLSQLSLLLNLVRWSLRKPRSISLLHLL